jgi:hypothetical protein
MKSLLIATTLLAFAAVNAATQSLESGPDTYPSEKCSGTHFYPDHTVLYSCTYLYYTFHCSIQTSSCHPCVAMPCWINSWHCFWYRKYDAGFQCRYKLSNDDMVRFLYHVFRPAMQSYNFTAKSIFNIMSTEMDTDNWRYINNTSIIIRLYYNGGRRLLWCTLPILCTTFLV